MKIYIYLVIFCCSLGCAPGLGKTFNLQPIEVPITSMSHGKLMAQLRPFTDSRPNKAVIVIAGREIQPEQDVSILAESAFRAMAEKSGINLLSGLGPIISVNILAWHAKVSPGFPTSNIEAIARLEVRIFDDSQNLAFRSTYDGSTQYQHPLASETNIAWTLNDAMEFALKEIFRDERLSNKITELLGADSHA